MQVLKADTAIKVRIGPFVDVGDGFTPETGVTLGSADEAELLKANGAATVDISGSTWAAIAGCDGWYDLSLTSGNLDTEGTLEVIVQDDSVCLPVHVRFQVVNANVFDSLWGTAAADYLQVDTIQVTGTGQTANDNGADINAILVDTNEMQGKLPTNKFMGSSDGADDDGNINAILTDTGTTLENRLIAIEADTDVIDDGTSGLVKIAQDVAAILTDTGTDGVVLANNAIAAAKVTSTALDNVVMSDLGAGAPSATAKLTEAINYLYEAWRNKTTRNATEIALYKDDAATKLCESTVSDDGTTATKGEYRAAD